MQQDAPTPLSVAPADLTADDRRAIADIAAGRVIDSDAMTRRLGGWQIACIDPPAAGCGEAGPPQPRTPEAAAESPNGAVPLLWTRTAMTECDRIGQLLAAFGQPDDRRFAAALVAATIRLIVDGVDGPGGIVDVPLLTPFALRIVIDRDRLTVLGLRERPSTR